MAKRKRAPHEKPFSRPMQKPEADATDAAVAEIADDSTDSEKPESSDSPNAAVASSVADPFIGKWNQLVSTTNWDKGQIICEWREALIESDADVTEYSDEAWAQLVGGVTSQHVGRLRRVYQRFGDVTSQYEGLFWSHFQACLDWDDAEMWLEGSIQNGWSVSQMRGQRWEALGTTPEAQQAEAQQVAAEQAAESEVEAQAEEAAAKAELAAWESSDDSEQQVPSAKGMGSDVESSDSDRDSSDSAETSTTEPVSKRTRLSVDVESLPDDLAEAFESFKLAIIAHRRENWRDTTPESVVECLESLKQLALAEAE